MERDLIIILRRIAADVERDILHLESSPAFSHRIAADQRRLILSALRRREAEGWTRIGHTVSAHQAHAAAAAVESMQDRLDVLMKLKYTKTDLATFRSSAVAEAERNVDAAIARELGSKITLSQQVYRTRQLASGQIDRFVTQALGRGLNAREIAREAKRFIKPDVPGGMSYAAMRLGRTEINNAFHATQISYAKGNPLVTSLIWNLSGSHKRPDQCDDYASHGPWIKDDVPRKPHPQCFCYLTAEVEDNAAFLRNFAAGKYDSLLDQLV
jgi:hypothetical protein